MAYIRKSLIFLPLILVVVLPVSIAHYFSETKVSAQTGETPGSLMACPALSMICSSQLPHASLSA